MASFLVNGVRLSFTDEGAGEPVICLHGSASSSGQWQSLSAHLRDRYRVLAPDLHGYGETSPWGAARALRLEDEAALISALVTHCGAPVHLVGHSYGGAVALTLALAEPGRIQSLTLVEPAAFTLLPLGREHQAFAAIHALKEACVQAVWEHRYAAAAEHMINYWNGGDAWRSLPEQLRTSFRGLMPKVALEWEATLADTTPLSRYTRLAVPTLLLAGDRSPLPARLVTQLLSGALPNCTYTVVPGAGHMAPLTHPSAVNTAIEAHIERNSIGDAVFQASELHAPGR